MRNYHVNFWSGERSDIVGFDVMASDDGTVLERLASAGRYALDLRRGALPDASAISGARPRTDELGWLAFACGPLWLFVIASWWLG